MPTVLLVAGWRLFFYSNEGNEPMHIHARKADAECKFRIHEDRFDIEEADAYNMSSALRKQVRQIVFQHFDDICVAWREHFKDRK